jgi:hypothetical protein
MTSGGFVVSRKARLLSQDSPQRARVRNKADSQRRRVGRGLGDEGRGVLYKQTQFFGNIRKAQVLCGKSVTTSLTRQGPGKNKANFRPDGGGAKVGITASVRATKCAKQTQSGPGCPQEAPAPKVARAGMVGGTAGRRSCETKPICPRPAARGARDRGRKGRHWGQTSGTKPIFARQAGAADVESAAVRRSHPRLRRASAVR